MNKLLLSSFLSFSVFLNIIIGSEAGRCTTESYAGIFIGQRAGKQNTTGNKNIFIGTYAGDAVTSGCFNEISPGHHTN